MAAATVDLVAEVDARALRSRVERANRSVIRIHRLYFFLLKHDLLDPEVSPVPGICWRPLVGPHAIDARMIRATPVVDARYYNAIGELTYQICRRCRLGMIWKVATDGDWQHNGIATAMIRRGRLYATDYAWSTSEQLPDAVQFWRKLAERTGLGYRPGDGCKHMRRVGLVNARDRIRQYPGARG